MTEQIHYAVVDGVATISLDHPPVNAMTLEMAGALDRALSSISADPSVRALIVLGRGTKAFCAGSDIKELQRSAESGNGAAALLSAENLAFNRLAALDIPTIAAIHGNAVGGGVELALCCDYILATTDASFSLPEVRLGVYPGVGGTVRLPLRIGLGRATDLIMTGRTLMADDALAWGLVNKVVDVTLLHAQAEELARRFTQGPRHAYAGIKKALRLATSLPMADALEQTLALSIAHGRSPDAAEGLRAFLAGEKPKFGN